MIVIEKNQTVLFPGHALIAEAWMRKMCPGLYTYNYAKPDGGAPCS